MSPDLAARVAINHGLAEEIIPLDPDLIIAGAFSTRTAVALLKRTSIRLVEFGIPQESTNSRTHSPNGAACRRDRRGESDRSGRWTSVSPHIQAGLPVARPRAIVLNPNGATVGRGTLVDEIMTLAGLDNVAAELGSTAMARSRSRRWCRTRSIS